MNKDLRVIKSYIKSRFFITSKILKKVKNKNKRYNKENIVPIAISTNRGFLYQTMVMISSLENAKCTIRLYILNITLTDNDIEILRMISPDNVDIIEVKISGSAINSLKISDKWPVEAWSRIVIPDLIDEDYVLYLDVDCIIVGDLYEIINTYRENIISGVKSTYYYLKGKSEIMPNAVNSGVLLMNNIKLKEMNFSRKVIEYALKNENEIQMPDQDSINYICRSIMKNISPKYNAMNYFFANTYKSISKMTSNGYYTKNEFEEALYNPAIIHYNGGPFSRPWQKGILRHPYEKIYRYYEKKIKNIKEYTCV